MWLLVALSARADDLSFSVTRIVPAGSTPEITFSAARDGNVTAKISCSGRSFSLARPVSAGGLLALPLPLPEGAHRCSGSVRFEGPEGDWAEAPLQFDVSVRPPLTLRAELSDVDLPGHHLVIHADQPLSEAKLSLIGLGGGEIDSAAADLSDPKSPRFSWSSGEEVLLLRVSARDRDGIGGTVELSPWSYAIPHEDVVFASGSDVISSAEAPKLERCWSDVASVREKYGAVVDIELFVAGFTDTVGPAANNQALSERRARAIAAWFRSRGFSGAIWYQGFGESAQAVRTADEVDEARNRRALYLLSAQAPQASPALPASAWRPL